MRNFLNRLTPNALVINVSWMMSSEFITRLSRLLTIIVLGIYLEPIAYGTVMLAIVCHDLLRVISQIGIGAQIIQCSKRQLPACLANGASLQWMLCLAVSILQISCARDIADYFENPELANLLVWMALSNLLYPIVAMRVFLVQRNNKMKLFAGANALSVSIENLSMASFVFSGFAEMSLPYAKFCSAFSWVMYFTCLSPSPRYKFAWQTKHIKALVNFGSKILATELTKLLRRNVDTLFAAKLLSPELFGIYSFAKSAGLGISQSLSQAFLTTLYPYLSRLHHTNERSQGTKLALYGWLAISLLFVFQSLFAPIYIDFLFAPHWHSAANLVSILCLSAIASLYIDIQGLMYRIRDNANMELYLTVFSLLSLSAAFYLIQPSTVQDCAALVTLTSFTWIFLFMVKQHLDCRAKTRQILANAAS